jgi:hypothetical protein
MTKFGSTIGNSIPRCLKMWAILKYSCLNFYSSLSETFNGIMKYLETKTHFLHMHLVLITYL